MLNKLERGVLLLVQYVLLVVLVGIPLTMGFTLSIWLSSFVRGNYFPFMVALFSIICTTIGCFSITELLGKIGLLDNLYAK